MADNKPEEIDLFLVLDKLTKAYHGLLASIYRGVRFIVKHWIVLLVLILGGYFGGQYWQRQITPTKEAKMIVQNNFDSSSYVYNAIDLLNVKYKQGDKRFLTQYGFDTDTPDLDDILIEPIVNIMDLLEKTETSDRSLDSYLNKADFEEDLLISEAKQEKGGSSRAVLNIQAQQQEQLDDILSLRPLSERMELCDSREEAELLLEELRVLNV